MPTINKKRTAKTSNLGIRQRLVDTDPAQSVGTSDRCQTCDTHTHTHTSSAQELAKELGKTKAELSEDYLDASDQAKLGIRARETGRIRRRLSIVLQKALAYRTLRYVARQSNGERMHRKPVPPQQSSPPTESDGFCPPVAKRIRQD